MLWCFIQKNKRLGGCVEYLLMFWALALVVLGGRLGLVTCFWGVLTPAVSLVQIRHAWDSNQRWKWGMEWAEGGRVCFECVFAWGIWNGSYGMAPDRWVIWPGSQAGIDGDAPDQWRGCTGATGVLLELINARLHSWTGFRSSRINGECWTLWFNSHGAWSIHGVHGEFAKVDAQWIMGF